jgi:hypothetical protein
LEFNEEEVEPRRHEEHEAQLYLQRHSFDSVLDELCIEVEEESEVNV